ncbi:MAG: hypothetical protein QG588_2165 [Candidatus Poribacteria bacterium]|nr:hypothetical protein [Candidatus Poribacteria bacterium]
MGRRKLILIFALFYSTFTIVSATSCVNFPGGFTGDDIIGEYDKASASYNDLYSIFDQNVYHSIILNVIGDVIGKNVDIQVKQGEWQNYYKIITPTELGQEIGKLEELREKIATLKRAIDDDYLKMTSKFYAALDMMQMQIDAAYAPLITSGSVVTPDGVGLHYKILGTTAPPILLLSGGPGFSSNYLLPVAEILSEQHQCILLDIRGTGESRLGDYTGVKSPILINDIKILREHLGINEWIIFGHSWGGRLAMAYASESESCHVKALVLVASAGLKASEYGSVMGGNIESGQTASELESAYFWNNDYHKKSKPSRSITEVLRSQLSTYVFDDSDALPVTWMLVDDFNPELFNQITAIDGTMNKKAQLISGFTKPVLIIQGEQDPMGVSTAYSIRDSLTNVPSGEKEFIIIPACGHFPWIEKPYKFFKGVTDFLNKHP